MNKILYHGTDEYKLKRIMKDKLILSYTDNLEQSECTSIINNLLNDYADERVRDDAVFLTDSEDSVDWYEYKLEINVENLNTNLLSVADNHLADKIYDAYYYDNNEEIDFYIKSYLESIISFDEYLKNEEEYNKIHKEREFLYFGDINIFIF